MQLRISSRCNAFRHGFVMVTLLLAVATVALGQIKTEYVEGEVIVTFKETMDLATAKQTLGRHALPLAKHFELVTVHRRETVGLVRMPGRTTADLIAELKKDSAIQTVEPNYLRWFQTLPPTNETFFAEQWSLHNTGQTVNGTNGLPGADIKFVDAWDLAAPVTGSVVVAVIDSGVDYTHPDLASNMWTNVGGDSVDGYAGVDHGYDFLDNVPDPMDSGFHGTHVSGTIAASGGNHQGVIGVNFHAQIMALKVSNDGTTTPDSAVIEAIQFATAMKGLGVNIVAINASFGGGGSSAVEQDAIEAAGAAGIVFCAAAGNSSNNNDTAAFYPAGYRLPNMIVVAASDQNDALADFSDYGAKTVDLAAPGVNILSTIPVALAPNTGSVQQATVTFGGSGLTFAGSTTGITAAVYDCGLGYPGDFPPAVNGNIALIERGTLFFTNKVGSAMAAGAIAAIIYNNTNGNFLGNLQYPTNWIPAVSISQADGLTLEALLPTTVTVVSLPDPTQAYTYLDGTSMATPHVAGTVAFLATQYPDDTPAQRIQRVLANVDPVTGLQKKVATGGRLNLLRSLLSTPPPKSLTVKLAINFVTNKLDSAQLTGVIELPVGYRVSNVVAQLEIGSVTVPFTLDGKGVGLSGDSTLKMQPKGKPAAALQPWQVSATLRGDWNANWATDGLVNATTNAVITIPVFLFLDGATPEVFSIDKTLHYKATAGKTGSAK